MRRDEAFLWIWSLLLPPDDRAVYRERWAADLRDAAEVGLSRGAVLRGVAIFALRHLIRTLPVRAGRHRAMAAAARAFVGGSVIAALLEALRTLGPPSLSASSASWLLSVWAEVALWCALAALAASLVRRWGEGAVILFAALTVAVVAQAVQAVRFDALDYLQALQGGLFLLAEVLFVIEHTKSKRQTSSTTTAE